MKKAIIKKAQRGFTLIELMIVVAIIGILAAIAIPNFTRFQAKSKQSEVKMNLKAVFTAAKSYFAEKDTYAGTSVQIGFSPELKARYTYNYNATTTGGDAGSSCKSPTAGTASATTFTAYGQGNIDTDTTCDDWNITDTNTLNNTSDDVAL